MDSSSTYMYHQPYIHHGYASLFLESTPLPSPHTVFLCQTLFNLFFLLSLCNDRWLWQLSLPWLRIPLLSVLYYCSVQKYGKVVVHKWNFLCLSHNLSPVIGFTSFRSQNRQWVGGPQIDRLTIIWVLTPCLNILAFSHNYRAIANRPSHHNISIQSVPYILAFLHNYCAIIFYCF